MGDLSERKILSSMNAHNLQTGPLLEVKNVKKAFGHVQALNGVSFAIGRASVVALLGDNGAGKSSLISLLNGLYTPDSEEIIWQGQAVRLSSPRIAATLGIATVFQDLAMVDEMSIYRNMFLGREELVSRRIGPFYFMAHSHAKREASKAIEALGIKIKSTEAPVEVLSGGQRQSIAIARAVHFGGRLLVLDEPTSALSLRQTAQVLATVERTREKGASVLFISHNVRHAFQVADHFVVLSQGEVVGDVPKEQADFDQISTMIMEGKAVER
jgi:simple sugar transport system ATP-binding protein